MLRVFVPEILYIFYNIPPWFHFLFDICGKFFSKFRMIILAVYEFNFVGGSIVFCFCFFFFFGYTSYAAFLKEFLFAIFKAHQGNIQFSLPLEWWVWYLSKYVCVCVFLHHPIQWFSFSSQWHLFQGCFISTGVVRDTFLLHFSLFNVLRSLCGKVWESAHIDKLFFFFVVHL